MKVRCFLSVIQLTCVSLIQSDSVSIGSGADITAGELSSAIRMAHLYQVLSHYF